MDKGLTVPKMGTDISVECPKIHLPKLSAQAQKFEIIMKKVFIVRP
jgi:hypothetical protein